MGRSFPTCALGLLTFLTGCSGISRDSGELFRVKAECANQARQFKSEWLQFAGPDYRHSLVRNHYNVKDAKCYVEVHTNLDSDGMSHFEVVHDATKGLTPRRLRCAKFMALSPRGQTLNRMTTQTRRRFGR